MKRIELSAGVTRIILQPAEDAVFESIVFADEGGEFLRQTGFNCTERPVYRMAPTAGEGKLRQTANGDVIAFDGNERRLLRISHSAELRFACRDGEILTGLGQHEDGIFDYSRREERLYQHNMKIAIPFLLCSAGWGLLIEAGCAMRYRGEGNGFVFALDAAEEISYVVIRAVNCAEVLKKLAMLTGKPALLPKWAYGYIQSKERYKTAAELTDTAAEFRRLGIGLDCIVLDWCSWREGCWGDKMPDPERFPDIRALTDTLHEMKVHWMVSVWPNTVCGQDCNEFEKAGLFLPGSQIYDAFSDEAREMYWEQCKRYWISGGVDALWCDSDEPITDPDWCGSEKRSEDERMRLITEASEVRMDPERLNDYGAAHLRGLYDHWRKDIPEKRPVILSRSGGPNSSALGVILWSGDVAARWDVLRKQVTEAIRTACSGICWWTLDIGAFFVGRKEPWFWRGDYQEGVKDPGYRELYLRWFQFGSMLPVFRSHGTDTPREPWQFGGEDSWEYRCLRDTIALRYRLMPYLYATAAQACRDGLPMIRAMMTAFPEEKELAPVDDQYMLGDMLLVKPVTRPLNDGGNRTEVLLPAGGWYDLFTEKYTEGGRRISVPTPICRWAVYIRAGGILPEAEGAQCAEDLPFLTRKIRIFGGTDGTFDCYDDTGDGYGNGVTVGLEYRDDRKELTIRAAEGKMPEAISITVIMIQPDGTQTAQKVRYDGTEMKVIPAPGKIR